MSYPYYGNQNKPQYNEGYNQNDTRVVMEDVEPDPRWNWCAHGWSMFGLFCCPWFLCLSTMCSMCGLVFAQSAYTDHKAGDHNRARYKKSCSIGWTVVALILSCATLALILYYGVSIGKGEVDISGLKDLLKILIPNNNATTVK